MDPAQLSGSLLVLRDPPRLEQDYKLAPSDLAQVLGTAVELRIGEVADRNASVIARVRKDQLAGFSRP